MDRGPDAERHKKKKTEEEEENKKKFHLANKIHLNKRPGTSESN